MRGSGLLLAVLAGCAAAPATTPPAPWPTAPAPVPPGSPRERLHVDVDGQDLAEVMDRIGREVGRTILVDPSVQESVTVSLRDIPWREAVDVIARMTRCEVEERPGGVLVLTQCARIQFGCLLGANVRTLIQLVCAYRGATVTLPPELDDRVTCRLELTGDVAGMVRQVLAPLGDEYVVVVEAGERHVRVVRHVRSGTYLGHDEDTLWLQDDDGRFTQLRLPPRSATGLLGERRRGLLRALRLARRGDRIRARCAWRDHGDGELVELLGR